jgi:hypothetical protein
MYLLSNRTLWGSTRQNKKIAKTQRLKRHDIEHGDHCDGEIVNAHDAVYNKRAA